MASLGVSRFMRPLLRRSRAGVSFAARRCKALIACGVVGTPLPADIGCNILPPMGIREWYSSGLVAIRRREAGRDLDACPSGVEGLLMISARSGSFEQLNQMLVSIIHT